MKAKQACVCLYVVAILTVMGCSHTRDWSQITFMVTALSGDFEEPIVFRGENVTQDKAYIRYTKGQGRWSEEYIILRQHVVEDKRYIYVPFAEGGSGSGTFWQLQVIDKETRTTTDYAILGDRIRVKRVSVVGTAVTVEYQERSLSGEPAKIVVKQCHSTHYLKVGACAS